MATRQGVGRWPAQNRSQNPNSQITCPRCPAQVFQDWDAYAKHKVLSRNHTACDVCAQDFNTDDALRRHRLLLHPAEQDLGCAGCDGKFTRLGSLMNHLETENCWKTSNKLQALKQMREMKERFQAGKADRDHDAEYGRARTVQGTETETVFESDSGGVPIAGFPPTLSRTNSKMMQAPRSLSKNAQQPLPTPNVQSYHNSVYTADGVAWGAAVENRNTPAIDEPAIAKNPVEDEDLISFDDEINAWPGDSPKATLAHKVFKSVEASKSKQTALPSGPSVVVAPKTTPWSVHTPQTPNLMDIWNEPTPAEAAAGKSKVSNSIKPLSNKAFENMTIKSEPAAKEEEGPIKDPDNPKFQINGFYRSLIRKFQCPHYSCGKSFASTQSFVSHLRAPIHKKEYRVQCRHCLRYYAGYTALTQHSESQGVRCQVRDSESYDEAVDDFTRGISTTNGRHGDLTVKYANKDIHPDEVQDIMKNVNDADKAAKEGRSLAKKTYWESRDTKW